MKEQAKTFPFIGLKESGATGVLSETLVNYRHGNGLEQSGAETLERDRG